MSNNDNNGNYKLAFGLLAGAAIGYWLNSEHGRRTISTAQTTANDYSRQAVNLAQEKAQAIGNTAVGYYEQSKETVTDALSKAADSLNTATETIKQRFTSGVDDLAETAHEEVDVAENKLQKGIARAKRKVDTTISNA